MGFWDKNTKENLQSEHDRGGKDYSSTKDNFFGARHSTPWSGVLESDESYKERVDAYNSGWENAHNQHKEGK